MKSNPKPNPHHYLPPFRRLRGFSFDPSLSAKAETAPINERIYTVPWETLQPGPIGDYVEVVDVDPASAAAYAPVNLDAPHLLAQDGLPALSSNPQFHQQMVYAVAMTTIHNFERALGRPVMWSDRGPEDIGKTWAQCSDAEKRGFFVQRLRIYPHALREANAYYSPLKKALLFGYFPTSELGNEVYYPGGIVFSCLSHDIIAHETTHAILDGIHQRFMEVTQPDGLAFHEAFSDIVAMFQHFTFTEVVRHQIAKTRGNLEMNNLLGELAQEFGRATGNHGSLRSALGEPDPATGKWTRRRPDPRRMATDLEPHDRGAILVSAVFDAFVAIYNSRIADLRRIASGGTGILQDGELHPDLVNRLTQEAVKVAGHVLTMCIRALDYCPPVDITFGDYLRALITADRDVVPVDTHHYRLAFIDAFRQHGIYPRKLRSLSEESLTWDSAAEALQDYSKIVDLGERLKPYFAKLGWSSDRETRWHTTRQQRIRLHSDLQKKFWRNEQDQHLQEQTGLDFGITNARGEVKFELHSLWPARRLRPDGTVLNQVVFSILQHRPLAGAGSPEIWGGCTFIVDLDAQAIRYVIRKPLYRQEGEEGRITRARQELENPDELSLAATYGVTGEDEPFALLHTQH